MTESELQRLLRESPEKGQRAFFDKYFGYVYTIVYARLRNVATAEDIDECVGDVFAYLFLYFDEQEEFEGNMKAFTAAVARRRAIDTYRSLSRRFDRTVSISEAGEVPSEENIAEAAELSELRSLLYRKVTELDEPDSTIIIQKYFYGRSSREIAGIVGISADNVRARCSRAVKKLKEMLLEEGITL